LGRLSSHKKPIGLWAALIAVVLTVLFGKLPDNSLFWQEVQNSAHTFSFAVVAVLILLLLQNSVAGIRRAPLKLYVVAGLTSLLVGVLTELVQLLFGSDFSSMDIMRDLTGIVAGLGLYASVDKTLQPHGLKSGQIMKAGIIVLSICVLAASLFPLAHLSVSYVQRNEAFPVILDLNKKWVEPFIQTKNAVIKVGVRQQASAGNNVTGSVLVQLNPGTYPGVSMIELYPDWSSFEMLVVEIYSEQVEPFDLVVRVHDEQHNNNYADRFNRSLIVEAGENNFHIPLKEIEYATTGRQMDMKKVNTLIIFAREVVVPLRFFLGTVRLE